MAGLIPPIDQVERECEATIEELRRLVEFWTSRRGGYISLKQCALSLLVVGFEVTLNELPGAVASHVALLLKLYCDRHAPALFDFTFKVR